MVKPPKKGSWYQCQINSILLIIVMLSLPRSLFDDPQILGAIVNVLTA